MATAARHVVGLNTHKATFFPADAPSSSRDNAQVEYEVVDVLKSSFEYLDGENGKWNEDIVQRLTTQPWFGENSGGKASQVCILFFLWGVFCLLEVIGQTRAVQI